VQILEFSGIGNPEILAKIGVEPKIDLSSVGENVQEHIFCALSWGTHSFFLPLYTTDLQAPSQNSKNQKSTTR
jgi:hypothetical protein